jgi:hypothetical protein
MLINSHDEVILTGNQDIIRKIFTYYQSGFSFSYFNQSFFYWIAKIAILLMIFTHTDLESIRRLKVENMHNSISLEKKRR